MRLSIVHTIITAILARSLAIPAVVSAPLSLAEIQSGTLVVLDGSSGQLTLNPDSQILEEAYSAQRAWQTRWKSQLGEAKGPAITRDGQKVEVVANIGNLTDAHQALDFGAEGVGLLRTEFLYLENDRLPTEEEQIAAYREIFQVMGERPIVVRTLDIGGDKPVDYLDLISEANPFLGWRAICMIKENPGLIYNQFRALLRAGAGFDLRIMAPMVSCLEEVVQARQLLDEAIAKLGQEGLEYAGRCQFGIMVEVPSAALLVEHLAKSVDFFSIGTNDLTQYTLAVDRTNERVAHLASPYHPAVIKLTARTIEKAHEQGKWVGLCGEMAGDALATPLLLGLGLDEFSMAPASIPRVKQVIRTLDRTACQAVAARVLELPTTQAVQDYLKKIAEIPGV